MLVVCLPVLYYLHNFSTLQVYIYEVLYVIITAVLIIFTFV